MYLIIIEGNERKGNEMKFENETQIINEAAKAIIKNHLNWSNSLDSMPSEGDARILGDMRDAYIDRFYGEDWDWDNEEAKEAFDIVKPMFEEARMLADKKWNAMIAIMDI